MNLATALLDLGAARDHLPEEALHWMLDNWDVAGPAASLVLARCARDPENATDHDMIAAYFLLTGVFGLQLLGLTGWVVQVFYGAALVIAVTVSHVLRKRIRS